MNDIIYLFDVIIPYWRSRGLNIRASRVARRNGKIVITLTPLFRVCDVPGYEDEWFCRNWKFINLPF